MTDKTKRKVNPRRRLLLRLMLGIGIFAVLMSAAIYALQPKGAQIVFIAPDDNGIDNIWLADLNDSDNPRQLTHYESYDILQSYHIVGNSILLIEKRETSLYSPLWIEFWMLDIETNQLHFLINCNGGLVCEYAGMNHEGTLFAYQSYTTSVEGLRVLSVSLFNLATFENTLIHSYNIDAQSPFLSQHKPAPRWIGDSDILFFRANAEDDEFIYFNAIENHTIGDMLLNRQQTIGIFSPDGSKYTVYAREIEGKHPVLYIWQVDKPDQWLSRFEPIFSIIVYDWHPDNQQILVKDIREPQPDEIILYDNISMLNTVTKTEEILFTLPSDNSLSFATFNQDGSMLLYQIYNDEASQSQFYVYEMNTMETMPLPLFGRNPQWVNGGH